MPEFRKKPVVIEAFQIPQRDEEPSEKMIEWLHKMDQEWEGDSEGIVIHTLEGDMHGQPGDWIIKGVHGEYYPCKPDIFDKTYEPVTD